MVTLTPRLQAVAKRVRAGARVADIGTDHAYLPVYLVERGVCPFAIACDIGKGPLQNARDTVRAQGLEETIDCRLGDGLSPVQPLEAEDIVIAGMGGDTTAAVLDAAPWVQNERVRLILQPMSHAEAVREWLFAHGFTVESEQTVAEGERVYLVLAAAYTGKTRDGDAVACYLGSIGASGCSAADAVYLQRVCTPLRAKLRAGRLSDAVCAAMTAVLDEADRRLKGE